MNWDQLACKLTPVEVVDGKIAAEVYRSELLIDFANRYIGGGVLNEGAVQEEIMFLKFVEPLVSLVFTEELRENEALLITGCQLFNETAGYSKKFSWVSNFADTI